MTEPTTTTEQPQQGQQQGQKQGQEPGQRMPDQLDLLALTLVGLQHQNQAMGGAIHAALLQVNLLLAARGQAVPASGTPGAPADERDAPRIMSRADMGFTGSVPAGIPGRPLPPHPDRTFGAARRRQADQAAEAPAAPPAPQDVHDTTTTDRGHQ